MQNSLLILRRCVQCYTQQLQWQIHGAIQPLHALLLAMLHYVFSPLDHFIIHLTSRVLPFYFFKLLIKVAPQAFPLIMVFLDCDTLDALFCLSYNFPRRIHMEMFSINHLHTMCSAFITLKLLPWKQSPFEIMAVFSLFLFFSF